MQRINLLRGLKKLQKRHAEQTLVVTMEELGRKAGNLSLH